MVTPYQINGTITTSASVAASSATVYARNETTSESINITTNSLGQYILDLGNLTSGFSLTDYVTIYCSFSSEYAESTILLSDDTHAIDLILVVIVDPGTTNYCSVSQVWAQLDGVTASDISASRVTDAIQRAESEIDEFTETKFVATTITNEILAWNKDTTWKSAGQLEGYTTVGRSDYFSVSNRDVIRLDKHPVISITSLETNSAGITSADSWTTLTQQEGSGGDFIISNKILGELTFVDNFPNSGERSIRTTYIYGTSTVPKNVERLTILLSVREILMSKMHSSQFDGVDPVSIQGINLSKGIRESGDYLRQIQREIIELYKSIPRYKTAVV